MVDFKINISDKTSKKTYKLEVKSPDADNLLNKKIRDKVKGELFNLNGYELQITGGSDKAGFPMVSFLDGFSRKKVILSKGKGFKKVKRKYEKKRKTVRGRVINSEISQINLKVVKSGKDSIAKALGLEQKPEQSSESEAKPQEVAESKAPEKNQEKVKPTEEKSE